MKDNKETLPTPKSPLAEALQRQENQNRTLVEGFERQRQRLAEQEKAIRRRVFLETVVAGAFVVAVSLIVGYC